MSGTGETKKVLRLELDDRPRSGVKLRSPVLSAWGASEPAGSAEQEDAPTLMWGPKPRSAVQLAPGVIVGNKYELVRPVGKGGMSSVWEALVQSSDDHCQLVALKVLSPEALNDALCLARFEREAQLASSLHGQSFPAVYDWGVHGGVAYIAMQLLHGEDLFEQLWRRGELSVWETLAVLRPLARALDAVHAAGVVHRDLKPRNVFFAKDGSTTVVKLIDFGVAQPALLDGGRLTQTGMIVGSPRYMSPEQIRGGSVGPQSDLWSLTAILYNCLTNRAPFEGRFEPLLRSILLDEPPPVSSYPGVPRAFDAFFARGFAKDAARRFASAGEMVDAFESILINDRDPRTSRASIPDDATIADVAW